LRAVLQCLARYGQRQDRRHLQIRRAAAILALTLTFASVGSRAQQVRQIAPDLFAPVYRDPNAPAHKPPPAPAVAAKPAAEPCWADCGSKTPDRTEVEPSPAKPAAPVASKSNKSSTPAPPAAKPVVVKEPARFQAPAMNKNSIVLQVAATKQQRDALDMADILQKKKFPSFVANSPADAFYHVQVGPYSDMASAESAKRALEQLGFKSIIKH
jgi:cell division septation protein DedD